MKRHIFLCCSEEERKADDWQQLYQWLMIVGYVRWLGADNFDEIDKDLVNNASIVIVTDGQLLSQLNAKFTIPRHALLALPRASLPALINLIQKYAYTSFSEGIVSKISLEMEEARREKKLKGTSQRRT